MKVRHKATGVELEVRKQSYGQPSYYHLTVGKSMIHIDDPEWELVKEEEWEDVTGECSAWPWNWDEHHPDHDDDGAFYISHNRHTVTKFSYRLRKIDGLHHGPAFIVEKKKEL